MTTKECILGRRSIRKFTSQAIDNDVLREIIEEASYSPSWKNTQIVRYIAVSNPDLKEKISHCTSGYAGNGNIINNAPMVVALTIIKNRCGFERDGSYSTTKKDGWQMFDTGVAAQTFCLAAHERGIGSVILGILDYEKIAELLELPEDRELVTLIPIGYPEEAPEAPKRKSVDDLLTII